MTTKIYLLCFFAFFVYPLRLLPDAFQQGDSAPHLVVIEAENYSGTSSNGSADSWTETTAYPGYSGTGAMFVGPDDGNTYGSSVPSTAPVLSYNVVFEQTGTHYLWVRFRDIDGSNGGDSLHAGIDGAMPASAELIEEQLDGSGIDDSFAWAAKLRGGTRITLEVPSTGLHTVQLWAREDGAIVDRLLLTTDAAYVPTGSELESAVVDAGNAVDYYTQRFGIGQLETTFDLSNKTLTLTPDGSPSYYSGDITDATTFPESTAGAQFMSLGDDTSVQILKKAVFYGTTYNSFYISSNGYLSFDFGSSSYSPTLTPGTSSNYHFRYVRLAPFWRDLNPGAADGGDTYWQRIDTAGQQRTIVTFIDVPNYTPSTNRVNFQVVMRDSGVVTITWLNCQGTDVMVGLSRTAITNSTLPAGFTETNLSQLVAAGPPQFTSTAPTQSETGTAYSYAVTANDAQSDPITLTAPTLPAWLTFTPGANGQATLSGTATVAGNYPVQLEASDGVESSLQDFTIAVSAPATPMIDTQPQGQTVPYDSTVQFSVAASGFRPITGYQWRKNGSNLSNGGNVSGATSATLTLTGVTDADEATYTVSVTNTNGSTLSAGALLTVNPPFAPSFTEQPLAQFLSIGQSAQFSVTVSGSGPFSYQWQKGSVDLVNGGDVTGSTSSTLSIVNLDATDAGNYRVLVSNPAATDASSDTVALQIATAGTPYAPSSLTVLSSRFDQVQLGWTDNANNETNFRLERADSASGPWSTLATLAANTTSYTDSTVAATTTYYYRLFAYNAVGDSPPTSTLIVNTPADVPPEVSWTFDSNLENWTQGSGTRYQSSALYFHDSSLSAMWFSSTRVNLLAAQTYTVSFDGRTASAGSTKSLAFLATSAPGYPSNTTGKWNFSVTSTTARLTHDFTVPADGAYYLTFFSNDTWPNAYIDNVTLSGYFNASPVVTMTYPSANLRTLVGATIPFAVTATDVDGAVSRVDFVDPAGNLIAPGASDTTAPYTFNWTPTSAQTVDVIARAYDNSNAFEDSLTRTVTVEANHFSISTYLGDSATNDNITGLGFLSDGTLAVGAILDPALFTGVTPSYVNGATAGDRGIVARLSGDGRTVLSVTVVGARVLDLDIGGADRIHVAAGSDGVVVLNSDGSLAFAAAYGSAHAHRVDAAEGGTFGVITSTVFDFEDNRISSITGYLYSAAFTQLCTFSGASHNTTDLAIDEASETIGLIGWRNFYTNDGSGTIYPVDVPSMVGRDFTGVEKYRGYDWGDQNAGVRYLNRLDNNMADTRGSRIVLGPDGKFYAGFEFDGGNTPLRYSPFDLGVLRSDDIVGGDSYHSMSNTSTVPKTFVGRYAAATGDFELGQWITARLSNGNDNTTEIVNGNLLVDSFGRIHVVGSASASMPIGFEPLPGFYTGGAWHLVYSPDFQKREYMTRLTKGTTAAIAVAPDGRFALGGKSDNSLFLTNPMQSSLTNTNDAWFAVGDVSKYFSFQPGPHPRLFFDASELTTIRSRLGREPYASMLADLVANRNKGDFFRDATESDPKDLLMRANADAMLYALTGTQSYAASARTDVETAIDLIGGSWASSGVKGLDSYWYASKLAIAYDLCHGSEAWDAAFSYQMSKKLVDIATMIINNGGTEQNSEASSNWQAARASSGGLALLASDHDYAASLMDSAETRLRNFFNTNQGGSTRGWNPEGVGYTAFAIGSYVGAFAVALDELEPSRSVSNLAGLQWMPWTAFAGSVPAVADNPFNIYGLGGVKTDWSDDNGHIGGEGLYGFAFRFAPSSLQPGLRHAYDRLQGSLAPDGGRWDAVRHGTFWSILYYPEDIPAQNPLEIWDWHQANVAPVGLGLMTYRNGFNGADDILVQFKARTRAVDTNSHDGPDGLGFRVLGPGAPFVIGGGRNSPAKTRDKRRSIPVIQMVRLRPIKMSVVSWARPWLRSTAVDTPSPRSAPITSALARTSGG